MRPRVLTIGAHVAFADALAALLVERAAGDPMALARALVLLPNRRAAVALTEAFVRRAEGGLLLPAMRAVVDPDDADELDDDAAVPAAIDEGERRFLLAGMLVRGGARPARAMREAATLARALGELQVEDVAAAGLRELGGEHAAHWDRSLARLAAITEHWPGVLAGRGLIDPAERRARLGRRLARAWGADGAGGRLVVAAGVVAAPPFVAELMAVVARLPNGLVVLPGLDLAMADAAWEALTPGDAASQAHPQAALKRLLDALGVARGEVEAVGSGAGAAASRVEAAARALDPAAFTGAWRAGAGAALGDVALAEAATPAEEAQLVALALRRALETPGRTAALVTPDRALARRVAAHLARWGIVVDDSAGEPLATTPPGAFVRLIAAAAAGGFGAAAVLAALEHPFAGGEERGAWLARVRALDAALRGPGAGGLAAIGAKAEAPWWPGVARALEPLAGERELPAQIARLVTAAGALGGERVWAGEDGNALAAALDAAALHGGALGPVGWDEAAAVLDVLLGETVVRRAGRGHPRLAIYGLLEARLQRADVMVLGGLNEGAWPAPPPPDPWLPPFARRALGLPTLERRIGLAAHDFIAALGAREVLLTRARRDASAPTVPSRFLLRLRAHGALREEGELLAIARALDRPAGAARPVARPAPAPPVALRPRRLSVTQVETLAADPFAFYAARMLRLRKLDAVGIAPGARERGVFVHAVMEAWAAAGADPAALAGIARARGEREWRGQARIAALWLPRVERMMAWAADEAAARRAAGWRVLAAEASGDYALGAVTLTGRADRIDVGAGGALAVIDYKTGALPSSKRLRAGYSPQLGLLGAMIEAGGFAGVAGAVRELAYWRLSGGRAEAGCVKDVLTTKGEPPGLKWPDAAAFMADGWRRLEETIDAFLLGGAAFAPKLKPEFATQSRDFDQLARLDEWLGRVDD